jgi:hypothetical protein
LRKVLRGFIGLIVHYGPPFQNINTARLALLLALPVWPGGAFLLTQDEREHKDPLWHKERLQIASMVRTGAGNPARLAIRAILALFHVAVAIPEAADAIEVVAKVARW